jgi:hypothetical protein
MIEMWEAGKIVRPPAPVLPDLTLRGFGNFHLGERTADAKKRDEIRRERYGKWMEDVIVNPEKYSPVVPFTDVAADLMGQKIEVRWWVPDEDAEGGRYLHCLEGTVKEVIPYSAKRPNYPELRLCKHPVALVEWDEVFGYKDAHIPMNPRLYGKENAYLGWNMLNADFIAALAIAEADEEEELRVTAATASAILDVGVCCT